MPKKTIPQKMEEPEEPIQEEDNSKYLLRLCTVQADAIKTLIETLGGILKETTITFDKDGAKLITMDNTHVAIVYLKLRADKFESYYCKKKIPVSINLQILFKLMKFVGKEDSLTFLIEKENRDLLCIEFRNRLKNTKTTLKLNLLDMENDEVKVPDVKFDSVIIMPSQEFHKICKDISIISDFIDIKSVGDNLIFSCTGDSAKLETIIGKSPEGISFTTESEQIIQGEFSLKYLLSFTKASSLHSSVQLYIKNDWPLVLEYKVASLGTLKFCLAPKHKD